MAGAAGLAQCVSQGDSAAANVAVGFGKHATAISVAVEGDIAARPEKPLWSIPGVKGKAFVDFQNDVHRNDLKLAAQEGYGHVELAKRYTTNGMATDQGKLSNVNAIGLLAEARGISPAEVGTTTFRPFYTPVSFGALTGASKGKHFQPVRKSPLHDWAEKNGAVFVETGLWYRSSWFPRAGETTLARRRRPRSAERAGKRRPLRRLDARQDRDFRQGRADFLNRVYCNGFVKLPVGKARYGLMLREDGMIYDDGTTSRLGENRYFMTTTTAYAAGVMNHLEFCAQALWPELDVQPCIGHRPVGADGDRRTEGAHHPAGDRRRRHFATLLSPSSQRARSRCSTAGSKACLFRISFSGELAYELAVPAGYGESVADALMRIGEQPRHLRLRRRGAERAARRERLHHPQRDQRNRCPARSRLRQDGVASPSQTSSARRCSPAKAFRIRRDRVLSASCRSIRSHSFRAGSHILSKDAAATLENDQGYLTSVAYSPHLKSQIGLALVIRGPERHGEEVQIWNGLRNEYTRAELCDPVFFDSANERLHV